ncbi:MAG: ABC transporter substrate-binding protein, partial [Chloroflexota bacterium]
DGDGMWKPLDYAAMSNAKDIAPAFQRSNHHGIGIGADQLGLLYNTKDVKPAPTSWADLWNPKYKGKVVFFDYSWYPVFMAAKLNGGGLQNMTPGWDLWKKDAKQIRAIVTSNPQYLNALSNGTGDLTSYFNGTGLQWARGGAPIGYVPPKEGAISVPVYLQTVVGNSANQQEVCQDAINEMISPKWCGQWAETSIEAPANSKTQLPANLAKLPAFSKATIDKFISVDWGIVGKQIAAWKLKWDQDIKANI